MVGFASFTFLFLIKFQANDFWNEIVHLFLEFMELEWTMEDTFTWIFVP